MSFNVIVKLARRVPLHLVFRWRSRIVANIDPIGLVIRKCSTVLPVSHRTSLTHRGFPKAVTSCSVLGSVLLNAFLERHFSLPDFVQAFRFWLNTFGHLIESIGGFMNPPALLTSFREHRTNRCPEAIRVDKCFASVTRARRLGHAPRAE